MTEREFEDFCREHGACNVDIDREIEVSFALDLLRDYFFENRHGCVPSLREVYNQIDRIKKIVI